MKYLSLDGVTKLVNKIKSSFVSSLGGAITTNKIISTGITIYRIAIGNTEGTNFGVQTLYNTSTNKATVGINGILAVSGCININGSSKVIKITNPSDNKAYTLDINKCIELGILTK